MLNAIQRDGGRTFLWNEPSSGFRQVLVHLVTLFATHWIQSGVDTPSLKQVTTVINSQLNGRSGGTRSGYGSDQTRFDPTRPTLSWVVSEQLALILPRTCINGARRIILTSRSGQKSLQKNPNVIISRMLNYLTENPELDPSFHAVDATAPDSMLIWSMNSAAIPSGGCIIVTAVLSDRVFNHFSEEEFTTVFHAKLDMIAFFDDVMYSFQQGQSVGRYVPNLNWEGLESTQGIPRIGHHLIPSQSTEVQEDQDDMERMADIVRGVPLHDAEWFENGNPRYY
ncbi:hypothetical protein CVT24_002745 [Panaeolus cyanescens]|uniref:Ketoreductase (KR) domain-containing protein n=1 Tax=Panaeolus cyanescens TaxID=181874 RepID=A0A409WJA7_9AGAR|nr:hypothetical protein CVT24_002745 [Panaeolus cyanescens]